MKVLRSIRRHWMRWSLGSAAGVVMLVFGGTYAYIHYIQGPAPAPLKLSTTRTTAAAGAPTSANAATVDGSWRVTTGSQAGYRIKETLFGQSTTAVGRTSAVTGSITITGTTVTTGTFTADLTKVSSDASGRDSQFQGRIMNTAKYPTATFTLTQPIQLASLPADGVQITTTATGNLTLHGTSKAVTFTVTAQRSGSTLQVSGSIPVIFADYSIANPSGGPATTADNGTLEFLLTFTHA